MTDKILILIAMIYLHIYDDFGKQGILATFKQKDYWKENYPDRLYKHDYLISLFMHSFSWSVSILLVPVVYLLYNNNLSLIITLTLFMLNVVCHMIVDHLKCNIKCINLCADQLSHIIQILISWSILF